MTEHERAALPTISGARNVSQKLRRSRPWRRDRCRSTAHPRGLTDPFEEGPPSPRGPHCSTLPAGQQIGCETPRDSSRILRGIPPGTGARRPRGDRRGAPSPRTVAKGVERIGGGARTVEATRTPCHARAHLAPRPGSAEDAAPPTSPSSEVTGLARSPHRQLNAVRMRAPAPRRENGPTPAADAPGVEPEHTAEPENTARARSARSASSSSEATRLARSPHRQLNSVRRRARALRHENGSTPAADGVRCGTRRHSGTKNHGPRPEGWESLYFFRGKASRKVSTPSTPRSTEAVPRP